MFLDKYEVGFHIYDRYREILHPSKVSGVKIKQNTFKLPGPNTYDLMPINGDPIDLCRVESYSDLAKDQWHRLSAHLIKPSISDIHFLEETVSSLLPKPGVHLEPSVTVIGFYDGFYKFPKHGENMFAMQGRDFLTKSLAERLEQKDFEPMIQP